MATIGVPKIEFTVQSAASAVAARLKNGIVAIILKDDTATPGLYTVADAQDLPSGLSATNKAYVLQALLGSRGSEPAQVILSVIDSEGDLVGDGAAPLAVTDCDYIVGPTDMNATAAAEVKAWLDTARTGYFIGKLVAADYAADSMAVVNFSASSIVAGGTTYTGAGYCARIAGILAATSIAASATYAPLEEVESVAAVADPDSAVDGGKLILLHDGRKAKIARAVNSLTTVPEGQSPALKKIKVVEAIDLIRSYAIRLTEDRYVGQKSNSYDNKLALVTELQEYLQELETAGVLAAGTGTAEVDFAAQRAWLKENGTAVESMSEQEILEADTGSHVFIALSGTILDAMEDFKTVLTIGGAA